MGIRNISHWEFEQLLPHGTALEPTLGEQVEWWTHKRGQFLGTIAKALTEPGWRYLLLEREPTGGFHVYRRRSGIESLQAASLQLVQAMQTTAAEPANTPNPPTHQEPPCANM